MRRFEFDEIPVRHNEEHVNEQMGRELPWKVDDSAYDSPHVKANCCSRHTFTGRHCQ